MKHYNNMSRKKQCTSVPCIERNRKAIIHSSNKFVKKLVALSFAFLWLNFLSASSIDFVIPLDNNPITHTLVNCDSIFSFSSDTLKTFYRDLRPRNNTITFCPQDGSQRLGVIFREFDLAPGDTLFVYDGPDTNAPLIDKAFGQGIEAAFGGAVFVSFNRATNISSCITFAFHTNGDLTGGMGWLADIKCADRIASFVPPIIPSQQLTCGAESIDVIIPAAEIIAECGPLRYDSAMIRIIETTTGILCGETCLSFDAGMQLSNPFGVGTYEIIYNSILDPSIVTSVSFEIKAPELICRQEVTVNTGTNCDITIFPEMVVEDFCSPIQGVLHYNILIKDPTGSIVAHGSTLTEEYPSLSAESMIICGNVGYSIEIQQVYGARQGSSVCASEKVTAICSSPLIIEDRTVPFFMEGPQTDTLFTCDFDIDVALASIPAPNTSDACLNTIVTLESFNLLENLTTCNSEPSYTINWLVEDACGNSARRTDTLRILRPTINQFINIPLDIAVDCNALINGSFTGTESGPIGLLGGIQVNGQFIITDTIFIDENNPTCDFQLQVRDIGTATDPGATLQRIYELIDLCNPQGTPILIETQSIEIVDQTAPFFTEGPRTDTLFTCDFDIDIALASIPAPNASDACSNTIVTLENVNILENLITCNSEPSYALNWIVEDAAGNSATRTDTLRIIRPTVSQLINIPLDIAVDCTAPINDGFTPTAGSPIGLLIGLQVDGQFIITDTLFLDENNPTCDFQLQVRDIGMATDPGAMSQRIYELIDLCNPQGVPLLIDTQSIEIIDQTAPFFIDGPRTDTMFTCDFNIDMILASIPAPNTSDACSNTTVTLENVNILENLTTCNSQPSYTINWLVEDAAGNSATRTDTLRIIRPTISQLINIPSDIAVDCSTLINGSFTTTAGNPIGLLSGLQVDGQFIITDTLFLDENNPTCDFQLQVRDIGTPTDPGAIIQRIYELIDLCNPQGAPLVIDTQFIEIIDQTTPFFIEGPRTDTMFTCDFDIDIALASIPAPNTSDACSNTIVTLENVNILENLTTCNSEPVYAINWLVEDAAGNSATRTDTLRIIRPTASQFINIPLDISVDCSASINDGFPTTENSPIGLLIGLQVDGQFIITDTLFLDENSPTCDFQLQVRDIGMATDLGAMSQRIYELIDLCNPQGVPLLIDTQSIEIIDQTAPFFIDGPRTDTMFTCDFDIDMILASIPAPNTSDACSNTIVTLENFNILENLTTCNSQPSYAINWLVEDAAGNSATRTDTLRIIRPNISQLINIPLDIAVDCSALINDNISRTESSPIGLLSGLQVDGQFIITDTLFLDENNPTCDFQLQVRDVGTATDCGAMRQRIYELIDLCNPQDVPLLIDTQSIEIIDTIAPIFTNCVFSELANAEQIDLPANSCQLSFDFPLPEATDNCDDQPIVREFTVQELVNGEWSNKAISIFQTSFSVGTFRIGYEAADNCGAISNRDTCFRYLTIRDTIAPIAICQTNQEIALGADGTATLSATEFGSNSRDNCGIEQLLIKRSDCLDGGMKMDTLAFLRDSIDLLDYSMEVSFECCDLFRDVLVELLVIDSSGNYNTCSSIVNPVDQVQPICMALPAVTRGCSEFEVTDIGRPTDLDGDNNFDDDEFLPLFPTQVFFFNQQFGDPSEFCVDNTNCIAPIIEQEYQLLEGTCRTLSIIRRYRAIDRSGNEAPWVEQTIDIIYEPDWVITFPADEFTNCDIDKIELPPSPIQEGTCDDFVWTFRDSIVEFESGNPRQIIRTYSVVNQCLTNGDDQWLPIEREEDANGIVRSPNIITASQFPLEDHFTYVQIISLVDNDAPFLALNDIDNILLGKGDAAPFGEEDQTFGSSPLECDDNRTFSVFARDCNELSTAALSHNWQFLQNGSLVDSGNTSSFLQTVLPDTNYTVIWQVADEFGNQTDTTVQYQFIDGVAPTPRCARGIIATIDPIDRMVTVHADTLDAGSFDNCNDQSELSFFLFHESLQVDTPSVLAEVQMLPQQIVFTCADEGIVQLLLFVVDASGNYSSCPAQVEIQAPIGIDCDETMIGGTITDRFGAPLEDAGIDIIGTNTNNKTITSDEAGNFQIMLPSNNAYTIVPSNNDNPLNGVSTFDLLLINRHIIGISIFTSPYQYIAADANRSGTVTTYDMVIIRRMVLGQMNQFPNNKSWRFINKDFQFQTSNPLNEVVEESYAIEVLSAENLYMDFIGIKVGDVNGDATATYTSATSRNFGTTFFIYTPDLKVERGKTYTIPFYAPQFENISGFQATFKFHDLILTNKIGGIVTPDNMHGWRKGLEGFLTTSWHSLLSHDNNTVLFSLIFEATTDGYLNELLSVTSDPTPAEAYGFSGHWLDCAMSFQSPDSTEILDFGSVISPSPSLHQKYTTPVLDLEGGVFKVSQNTPNPFATTTTINFYLPQDALTALSVFNIHGQNILQTTQHYSKGTNQIKFVSDQLPNGTYFYQVATPFGVATHKMLIAK